MKLKKYIILTTILIATQGVGAAYPPNEARIAGAIDITPERASEILAVLASERLVKYEFGGYHVTGAGIKFLAAFTGEAFAEVE